MINILANLPSYFAAGSSAAKATLKTVSSMANNLPYLSTYISDKATDVSESVKAKIAAVVQDKVEEELKLKSKAIGNAVTKKLYDVAFKDNSLKGIDINGNEVTIYKTEIELINGIVQKSTGFNLETDIPGLPKFLSKTVLKKLDAYLVNKATGIIGDQVTNMLTDATITAVGKALGASQKFVEGLLSKTTNNNIIDDADLVANLGITNAADEEKKYYQAVADHYIGKMKLNIDGALFEIVRDVSLQYTEEILTKAHDTSSEYIKLGLIGAGTFAATCIHPLLGMAAATALGADKILDSKAKPSYLSQATEYITSYWNNDANKKSIEKAVQIKAKQVTEKCMPAKLAITDKILIDVDGTFTEERHVDEDSDGLNMSFINFVTETAPHSLTKCANDSIDAVAGTIGNSETARKVVNGTYDTGSRVVNMAKNAFNGGVNMVKNLFWSNAKDNTNAVASEIAETTAQDSAENLSDLASSDLYKSALCDSELYASTFDNEAALAGEVDQIS